MATSSFKTGDRLSLGGRVKVVEGVPFHFTRRRYGSKPQWYVWAHYYGGEQWQALDGDPWPKVTPSYEDLKPYALKIKGEQVHV